MHVAINNKAKLSTTVGLIGRAFVSVLNELDHAKLLKADSDIKDLGLVMTYYLYWVETLKGRGIELPSRKEVVGYAKKAGIELKEVGLFGTEERVKELEKEGGKIKALSGRAQPDRFDWKKKVCFSLKLSLNILDAIRSCLTDVCACRYSSRSSPRTTKSAARSITS